jgi:hypothetical protein
MLPHNHLAPMLRRAGLTAQAERIEQDVRKRLTPQQQHEQMIRLGFCDGCRYVVEEDGTFRPMTPAEFEIEAMSASQE